MMVVDKGNYILTYKSPERGLDEAGDDIEFLRSFWIRLGLRVFDTFPHYNIVVKNNRGRLIEVRMVYRKEEVGMRCSGSSERTQWQSGSEKRWCCMLMGSKGLWMDSLDLSIGFFSFF